MLQKNNLEEDIDLNSKLEEKSAPFIFEFAKKLKSENRAKEALEVLENSVEISNLYNDLSKVWRVDTHNWWEMSSKAEFLMLLGKVDEAIFDIENFLEMEKIEKFELNATLRQLKLYIHFTADKDAIKFYESLKIAYDNIF